MKYQYPIVFCLFIYPFIAIAQDTCPKIKLGFRSVPVCTDDYFKKYDPDSIARAHLGLNEKIYYLMTPADSMLKAHSFIYPFSQLGDNVIVVSSAKQSKRKRVIGFTDSDYTFKIMLYKDGIKHGSFKCFYNQPDNHTLLKEDGYYRNGKRQGKWRYWDEAGKLTEIKIYRGGELRKSFSENELRSVKLFRFGPTIHYGISTIELTELNNSIRTQIGENTQVPAVKFTFKSGFEFGNPSSLSAKFISNVSYNSQGTVSVSGTQMGGELFYTFLQTPKINYRFGCGLSSSNLYFKSKLNTINYLDDIFLRHEYFRNIRAKVLHFDFQLVSRKYFFKKKVNSDLMFGGFEAGYDFPLTDGKFIDAGNQEMNISQKPFSWKGLHFSVFIFVPTFN